MGLITFEGKPIEKLIEVISQGIGTLYKPRAIRKEADAEAYKIGVIEKAKAIASADSKIIDLDLYDNIQNRIIYQEKRKQENIDTIVEVAAEQLNQEENVAQEKVEPDWTTKFFNIAQDISDDEMQKLWGRILAGEIKQPKSYSLRALELLKNLTKKEAQTFAKLSNLAITTGEGKFVINNDNGKTLKEIFGITLDDILLLTEIGLIVNMPNVAFPIGGHSISQMETLIYGKKGIVIERPANTLRQSVHILPLTNIGIELSKLIDNEANIEYIKLICSSFSQPGSKIVYGDLVDINGERIIIDYTVFSS